MLAILRTTTYMVVLFSPGQYVGENGATADETHETPKATVPRQYGAGHVYTNQLTRSNGLRAVNWRP